MGQAPETNADWRCDPRHTHEGRTMNTTASANTYHIEYRDDWTVYIKVPQAPRQIRESVAGPGGVEGEFERVLPWNIGRWNADLRRREIWNNHLGHWQQADSRPLDAVLHYADTWTEPVHFGAPSVERAHE